MGDSPDLIVSDGNGYYAWVRSAFIDGDLDFANDLQLLYAPEPTPQDMLNNLTPKGLIANKYPIGLAIIEIPGFWFGHVLAKLTPYPADGVSFPYQLSVTLSLIILVLFSQYLFFLTLQKNGVNHWINILVSSLSLVATNLIHYAAKEPAMAHATGVALINLLIFYAYGSNWGSRFGWGYRLLIGMTTGLLVILCLSNVVLFPFIVWIFRDELKSAWKVVATGMGFSLMLGLHFLSLYLLWGKFIINPYQGESFKNGTAGLWEILLGNGYGVFLYHPWYLALVVTNIVGWFLLRETRGLLTSILFSTVSLWLINGLWGFTGDSFGSRPFIELLPLLSLGAATTLEQCASLRSQALQIFLLGQAIFLAGLNFYIWGGYLLQRYSHSGERTLAQVYFWILPN
ncbi:MAG: hypothetical protein AAGG02_09630 [Cyanobacteria bacterium P01_H01_bin.15]